eukprot:scaffold890_cov269-Pinguiococcus_pyrenoidosus.AAC.17
MMRPNATKTAKKGPRYDMPTMVPKIAAAMLINKVADASECPTVYVYGQDRCQGSHKKVQLYRSQYLSMAADLDVPWRRTACTFCSSFGAGRCSTGSSGCSA